MNVRIYLTDAIVSIVDRSLRLPTETLLKGMQAGMQLELRYEWFDQAPPPNVGGPRHFWYRTIPRPVTRGGARVASPRGFARGLSKRGEAPLRKLFAPLEKYVGHSLKVLDIV